MNESFDLSEKYVCQKCIQDPCLKEVVKSHSEWHKCSYCTSRRSSPLEYVIDRIRHAIGTVYGDLEDNLDVDGQVGDHYQIEEVLSDIDFHVEDDDLMEDIAAAFDDQFFAVDREKSYLLRVPSEAWAEFQALVKHKRRYTFGGVARRFPPELDDLLWSPGNLLENVTKTIHDLSLIVPVKEGAVFWRVRVHESGKVPPVPDDFTSPPTQYSIYANRMSPAGISMFYGADHFRTALLEVTDSESVEQKKCGSGIIFRAKQRFLILDLTRLPTQVSFFFDWDEQKRRSVDFLSSFVRDLSKPIVKDGREHIEYVPSQVFTEHVRYEVKSERGAAIMGIKYPSSRDRRGCYVLFVEQEGCLPSTGDKKVPQFLEAQPGFLKTAGCNLTPPCKWSPVS